MVDVRMVKGRQSFQYITNMNDSGTFLDAKATMLGRR